MCLADKTIVFLIKLKNRLSRVSTRVPQSLLNVHLDVELIQYYFLLKFRVYTRNWPTLLVIFFASQRKPIGTNDVSLLNTAMAKVPKGLEPVR